MSKAREQRAKAIDKLVANNKVPILLPGHLFGAWLENGRRYPNLIASHSAEPADLERYLYIRGTEPK